MLASHPQRASVDVTQARPVRREAPPFAARPGDWAFLQSLRFCSGQAATATNRGGRSCSCARPLGGPTTVSHLREFRAAAEGAPSLRTSRRGLGFETPGPRDLARGAPPSALARRVPGAVGPPPRAVLLVRRRTTSSRRLWVRGRCARRAACRGALPSTRRDQHGVVFLRPRAPGFRGNGAGLAQ